MNRFPLLRFAAGRATAGVVAVIAVAVLAGLIALWPAGEREAPSGLVVGNTIKAHVLDVHGGCEVYGGPGCRLVEMELRSGARKGENSTVTMPGGIELSPPIHRGDDIRVARNSPGGIDPALTDQLPIDDPAQQPFAFVDFERGSPLVFLVIAFTLVVVVLGRFQGARALIGLGAALWLLVTFVAPAIIEGSPPLLVALVGGLTITLLTTGLTHGVGLKSQAAMLGTAAALLLTAVLALLAVKFVHITGFSSEEATLAASATGHALSLQGLVLAGIVIGALGVLDDVTVSQASTVLALRRANPGMAMNDLFREALSVGRDHLGATVNTLVLAYAGAALPVLLIFSNQGTPFGEAVNREPVAEEIVAALVGSIGLMAAVPLTTALAAALAVRLPVDALPHDEHGHVH